MKKSKAEALAGGVILHAGDCLKMMATLAENSIDACVCDPPYHLTSIVKRFGAENAAPAKVGKTGAFARASRGFMGRTWDGGDIAFRVETWREVFRVLKPGGHLVAFGGTRTYHRMACAIEDAGFEVRDMLSWLYGSGFPKSHDLSKSIDRELGVKGTFAEPKTAAHAGWIARGRMRGGEGHDGWQSEWMGDPDAVDRNARRYIPASAEAQAHIGFGTAIKPACEPIALARKPLSEGTVAANVLKWGTGALNIDGCRVEMSDDDREKIENMGGFGKADYKRAPGVALELSVNPMAGAQSVANGKGRWPANVVHDGSPEVVGQFPNVDCGYTDGTKNGVRREVFGQFGAGQFAESYGDSGSAARFFYTAKADDNDRLGSEHPTVKPVDLVQWLIRLVTPPKGLVLDPFAGTGTAGEAAFREGMRAILIERETQYQDDIRRRMTLLMSGPVERATATNKAKSKKKPVDPGSLFGGKEQGAS